MEDPHWQWKRRQERPALRTDGMRRRRCSGNSTCSSGKWSGAPGSCDGAVLTNINCFAPGLQVPQSSFGPKLGAQTGLECIPPSFVNAKGRELERLEVLKVGTAQGPLRAETRFPDRNSIHPTSNASAPLNGREILRV